MSTRNKLVLRKKLEENIRKQQEDNLAGVINRYTEEIKFEETKTKSLSNLQQKIKDNIKKE